MKIIGEMMKKAIDTSHDKCQEMNCLHAAAMTDADDDVLKDIATAVKIATREMESKEQFAFLLMLPMLTEVFLCLYGIGLHTGYRLKEIEYETEKEIADLEKITR